MTDKPGVPIGESSPWWVAAIAWICGLAMFAIGIGYAGYVLDSFGEQSGRIAIEQEQQR